MVTVKAGVVSVLPLTARSVRFASRYQLNTGLVMVVVVAVKVTAVPEQVVLSAAIISAVVAFLLTVTVTTLADAASLAQASLPLTVT
ncbi:hypothetical protein D3C86_1976680 [compost metagenome]